MSPSPTPGPEPATVAELCFLAAHGVDFRDNDKLVRLLATRRRELSAGCRAALGQWLECAVRYPSDRRTHQPRIPSVFVSWLIRSIDFEELQEAEAAVQLLGDLSSTACGAGARQPPGWPATLPWHSISDGGAENLPDGGVRLLLVARCANAVIRHKLVWPGTWEAPAAALNALATIAKSNNGVDANVRIWRRRMASRCSSPDYDEPSLSAP